MAKLIYYDFLALTKMRTIILRPSSRNFARSQQPMETCQILNISRRLAVLPIILRSAFQVNFKMASLDRWCSVTILLLLIPIGLATEAIERHVKFQYKHSFKGPHLANKEGSIPFWAHGGSK